MYYFCLSFTSTRDVWIEIGDIFKTFPEGINNKICRSFVLSNQREEVVKEDFQIYDQA